MSRGPGKWQRAILEALKQREVVPLVELLPANYRHSDYSAIHRAADKLFRAHVIGYKVIRPKQARGPKGMLTAARRLVSVENVSRCAQIPHLEKAPHDESASHAI